MANVKKPLLQSRQVFLCGDNNTDSNNKYTENYWTQIQFELFIQ